MAKNRKRPSDVVGNAIRVARIATGEINDEPSEESEESAAAQLGRRGGAARAERLSPEQRQEIARKAAKARWDKENS